MHSPRSGFLLRIILPAAAAIGLFVAALFGIFIPTAERAVMERKREMIRELANVAVSTLARYSAEEKAGRMTRETAQREAVQELRQIRYGPEGKDYYWIVDLHPRMVMHPYVPELEGRELREVVDAKGRHLFLDQVERTAAGGTAYLEYIWQWKDDPHRRTPKLSYVRRFEPWGWIVGTGLYLEDVHHEMARMRQTLLGWSGLITAAIAGLLAWVGLEAGRSERRRLEAEHGLRESEARHRTLVQASTEGLLLLQAGRSPILNGHLSDLLGLDEGTPDLTLERILTLASPLPDGMPLIEALLAAPGPLELRLRRRDGSDLEALVRATRERLGEDEGIVVTVKDISAHRAVAEALDRSREWFRELAEQLGLGLFRATWGRHWRLLEASAAARSMLLEPDQPLADVDLQARFRQRAEAVDIAALLEKGEPVRQRMVELQGAQGLVTGRLSLIRVRSEDGQDVLEGLLEDASRSAREADRQAHLMQDLQLGQHALYQDLQSLVREVPVLPLDAPARTAAERMVASGGGAVFVAPLNGAPCGILTRRDLCDRLLAEGLASDTPLHQIMMAPLKRIPRRALVVEALMALEAEGLTHLAVTDEAGRVVGVLDGRALLSVTPQAGERMLDEILRVRTPEALAEITARIPTLVRTLRATGVKGPHLSRFLTALLDSVCRKALIWAEADLGPMPAPFAWVALGSHGRGELGLASDQDHALILSEGAPVEPYLQLGHHLSRTLAGAGWRLCPGGVMAGEVAYTLDLLGWKKQFSRWIHAGEPKDLLDVHIGFDLRYLAGDAGLVSDLEDHVRQAVAAHPPFLPLLAQAAQQTKTVLTKLGAIATEGEERLDLKNAVGRMSNAVRIYALRAGVSPTGTLDRLEALRRVDPRLEADHANLVATFEYLVGLRLQAHLDGGTNQMDLRRLTEVDKAALKKALGQVDLLNNRLAADFLGRG